MTMQCITHVRKQAARHRAEIDVTECDLIAWTPSGMVWRDHGAHCLVEPYNNPCGQVWTADACRDLARRISGGTMPCETADCDVCEDAREQNRGITCE